MFKNKRIIFITLLVLSLTLFLGLLYGCGGGPSSGSSAVLSSISVPAAPHTTPYPGPTPTDTPTPTPTQTSDQSISLYAVIIGIAAYPSPNALNYSDKDGRDFYNSLRQSSLWNSGAFAAALYNGDATKANIKKYMDDAAAKLKNDGMFVFFYSGHGSNAGGFGQLIPIDSIEVYANRISESDMEGWLAALPATSKKYVVIDSCFSGLFIDKDLNYKKDYGVTPKFIKFADSEDNFKGDYLAKSIAAVQNMVAITAGAGNESSYETRDLQSGVMTYYLVQGIGNGTTIGPAGNGSIVTAEASFSYAAPRVSSYAGNNNFVQTMQVKDNYSGDMTIKN